MAKASTSQDKYANRAYGTLIMSAANTITFSQLNTGANIHDKVAWIIHRVMYDLPTGALDELQASTDKWDAAVVRSDQLTDFSPIQSAVIDRLEINMHIIAAGTGARAWKGPIIHDLTGLPGGGRITPAWPIYLGLTTSGFAALSEVKIEIDFSLITLKPDDYWELVEATRVIS